jgi:hypothetical protein
MDIQGKGKTVQLFRAHNKAANVRCTKCNFAGYLQGRVGFQGRGLIQLDSAQQYFSHVYAVHGVLTVCDVHGRYFS